MKNINNYIIEKFKITKNTKVLSLADKVMKFLFYKLEKFYDEDELEDIKKAIEDWFKEHPDITNLYVWIKWKDLKKVTKRFTPEELDDLNFEIKADDTTYSYVRKLKYDGNIFYKRKDNRYQEIQLIENKSKTGFLFEDHYRLHTSDDLLFESDVIFTKK